MSYYYNPDFDQHLSFPVDETRRYDFLEQEEAPVFGYGTREEQDFLRFLVNPSPMIIDDEGLFEPKPEGSLLVGSTDPDTISRILDSVEIDALQGRYEVKEVFLEELKPLPESAPLRGARLKYHDSVTELFNLEQAGSISTLLSNEEILERRDTGEVVSIQEAISSKRFVGGLDSAGNPLLEHLVFLMDKESEFPTLGLYWSENTAIPALEDSEEGELLPWEHPFLAWCREGYVSVVALDPESGKFMLREDVVAYITNRHEDLPSTDLSKDLLFDFLTAEEVLRLGIFLTVRGSMDKDHYRKRSVVAGYCILHSLIDKYCGVFSDLLRKNISVSINGVVIKAHPLEFFVMSIMKEASSPPDRYPGMADPFFYHREDSRLTTTRGTFIDPEIVACRAISHMTSSAVPITIKPLEMVISLASDLCIHSVFYRILNYASTMGYSVRRAEMSRTGIVNRVGKWMEILAPSGSSIDRSHYLKLFSHPGNLFSVFEKLSRLDTFSSSVSKGKKSLASYDDRTSDSYEDSVHKAYMDFSFFMMGVFTQQSTFSSFFACPDPVGFFGFKIGWKMYLDFMGSIILQYGQARALHLIRSVVCARGSMLGMLRHDGRMVSYCRFLSCLKSMRVIAEHGYDPLFARQVASLHYEFMYHVKSMFGHSENPRTDYGITELCTGLLTFQPAEGGLGPEVVSLLSASDELLKFLSGDYYIPDFFPCIEGGKPTLPKDTPTRIMNRTMASLFIVDAAFRLRISGSKTSVSESLVEFLERDATFDSRVLALKKRIYQHLGIREEKQKTEGRK